MAAAHRVEAAAMSIDPKLIGPLLDAPYTFDFFRAVEMLEQLRPERAPVGEFSDPNDEVVRFKTHTSVAFPASAIQAFEEGEGDAPAEMTVNFLGLTGPQGVLPLDYTLYAANRERSRDYAMKDFFGVFEHRIISLFYRAWSKSRAEVAFSKPKERDEASAGEDWLTTLLFSV